jgi:hypothetical protein
MLNKRDKILIGGRTIQKYNYYFDNMRKYARELINENRQNELLPYLDDKSISIQRDVAGLLYHCYPELCKDRLESIAKMTVKAGLPKHYVNVSISAAMALEVGIPKDYP